MTPGALRSEFERRGLRAGRALLFDERAATAFIARAEEEHVAIADIDQVRPDAADEYEPLVQRALTDAERLGSWQRARLFVEGLSGRGLYFDIALEPAYATGLAKLKYLFRTGLTWQRGSRVSDGTLQ